MLPEEICYPKRYATQGDMLHEAVCFRSGSETFSRQECFTELEMFPNQMKEYKCHLLYFDLYYCTAVQVLRYSPTPAHLHVKTS